MFWRKAMKIEEAVRDEIKEVTAYMTPDGKLYLTRDEAVQAYLSSQSLAPYWAIGLGIIGLIILAALIF
jgi:hypothetical protein